jgi:hypothetical protein
MIPTPGREKPINICATTMSVNPIITGSKIMQTMPNAVGGNPSQPKSFKVF